MALISTVRRGAQRGLMALARRAYRALPVPERVKLRARFFLKTRLGVLFGRSRVWSYARWVRAFDTPSAEDARALHAWVSGLRERPRFTVIVPVPAGAQARQQALACLASVRAQLYPDAACRIAGPGANAELLREVLPAGTDPAAAGWRAVASAGGSAGDESAWLNAALAAADTPWLALLRHDAVLAPDALALAAGELQAHPEAALCYGDEDRLDPRGARREPWFKPQFDADLLLEQDYLGPLVVARREAVQRQGGLPQGSGAAAPYALALRLADGPAGAVRRIPFVLSHRQPGATGTPARDRREAVLRHLAAQGAAVDGVDVQATGDLHVRYALAPEPPHVTLIVPTRDRVDLLRTCVSGLLRGTDYPRLDVIVVDNRSREPATHAYFRGLAGDARVRIVPYDAPFNFSRMNNLAVKEARGSVIGLINNDIAVMAPGWLRELAGQALRPGVGAVGAKLLYGDGTVQHAGIVLGMLGTTGHVHRHLPGDALGHGRRLAAVQQVSAVTGACLIVRKDLYLAVGGMEEAMRVSCQDVDLCLRLASRGYRTIFTPHAVLHHLEGAMRGHEPSAAERAEILQEEALLKSRWAERMADDPHFSPNLSLDGEAPAPAVPPRVRRPWLAAAQPA